MEEEFALQAVRKSFVIVRFNLYAVGIHCDKYERPLSKACRQKHAHVTSKIDGRTDGWDSQLFLFIKKGAYIMMIKHQSYLIFILNLSPLNIYLFH